VIGEVADSFLATARYRPADGATVCFDLILAVIPCLGGLEVGCSIEDGLDVLRVGGIGEKIGIKVPGGGSFLFGTCDENSSVI
jgi:hypothetical protein